MVRLEVEVDQTPTMPNGNCHQCFVMLYQATNKKGIIGFTIMAE
jgi:hypothetical protein